MCPVFAKVLLTIRECVAYGGIMYELRNSLQRIDTIICAE